VSLFCQTYRSWILVCTLFLVTLLLIFRREVVPLLETMLVHPLVGWSVCWLFRPSVRWAPCHFENLLPRDCLEKRRRRKRKSADVENGVRQNCFAPGNGCPFLLSSFSLEKIIKSHYRNLVPNMVPLF
jgi:hypothetical protein